MVSRFELGSAGEVGGSQDWERVLVELGELPVVICRGEPVIVRLTLDRRTEVGVGSRA